MQDIAEWLESQGFREYAEAFARNKIDRDVLPSLTGEDLKEMALPRSAIAGGFSM